MPSKPPKTDSRTSLSEATYQKCFRAALDYLAKHEFIRNRDIRAVTGIGYDQAIVFFNRTLFEKRFVRVGVGGATRYAYPQKKKRRA